jgi:hypothetical protein
LVVGLDGNNIEGERLGGLIGGLCCLSLGDWRDENGG